MSTNSEPVHSSKDSNADNPLVSHYSILVLSVYLLGVVSGQIVTPGMEIYVLMAGLCGILAFVGIDQIHRRSQQKAHRRACEQAEAEMSQRIERHIPQPSRSSSEAETQPVDACS